MKYIEPSNSALFPARGGSYAAGNPVQGIAGSIVPPEAIEHPMREMENLLKAAGITPSESDLSQLEQSMRIFATCQSWPDAEAADLLRVSDSVFSSTTNGAFLAGDRILINREIIVTVTDVTEDSPYEVTIQYGIVPESITSVLNQRSYVPGSGEDNIPASLATGENFFLVSSGVGAWAAKTLAQIKTLLGLGSAAYTATSAYTPAAHAGSTGAAHGAATEVVAGFMSAADKVKLNGLEENMGGGVGDLLYLYNTVGGAF